MYGGAAVCCHPWEVGHHAAAESATGSERSLGESSYSCIINVLDKARAIIEELVGARIIALEVLFPERQAVRPLRVL